MCQVGAAALCSQINAGAGGGGHTWGHKLSMPGAGSLLRLQTADLIITSHASQVPATLGLARSCHVTPRQVTRPLETGDSLRNCGLLLAGGSAAGRPPHLPPGCCWPPGPGWRPCSCTDGQARSGRGGMWHGSAATEQGEDGVILEMVLAPPPPGERKTLPEHQPMALLLHTIL